MEVNPDGSTRRIFAQLSNFNGFASWTSPPAGSGAGEAAR